MTERYMILYSEHLEKNSTEFPRNSHEQPKKISNFMPYQSQQRDLCGYNVD